MATRAPEELTTARLELRRPSSRDAAAIYAYASDREATRFMAWPRHQSLDDTRAFLSFAEDEWRRTGCGVYLVRDAGGDVLGSTGLHLATETRAATGYILGRAHWGKGLATEAATAMIELARRLGLVRVEAECVAEHAASARVLEKLGMQLEGLRRAYLVAPNYSPHPVDVRGYARILA
jgi:[ribosomal protein S5]-alanine N-acetyltransferase